jgi:transcriptional regulator with XRE-family HTH domain
MVVARPGARAGKEVLAGRRRAAAVAQRLGVAIRDSRLAAGMSQGSVAAAAGISQPRVSELERGLGTTASIETWARLAAAVGEQLVGFLEAAPGATPPRDIEHLRRQAALIDFAKAGGWRALPDTRLTLARSGPAPSTSAFFGQRPVK